MRWSGISLRPSRGWRCGILSRQEGSQVTLTPDQIERRLAGISATDVSAIVGVNPYRSAVNVWASKRGEEPAWDGNELTRWGFRVEPTIREHYAEERGVRIEMPGTLAHPDEPVSYTHLTLPTSDL